MPTGKPHSFKCSKARGDRRLIQLPSGGYTTEQREGHNVKRTGKSKPNPSHNTRGFWLHNLFEYKCSCGHTGWTAHPNIKYERYDPE